MVDHIKLDKMGVLLTPEKITQQPAKRAADSTAEEGVAVTNQLGKLVGLLTAHEQMPDEQAKVMAVKSQIEAGTYKIDIHALSEKLLSSGVLTGE